MSTGLKIVLLVIALLVVAGIIGFAWASKAWDKVSFGIPKFQGLDLQGLTLSDLQAIALEGAEKQIKVGLSMDIKNENSFSIPFGNLKANFYYDGVLIAQTSPEIAKSTFLVLPNSTLPVYDTVTIILNGAAARKAIVEKSKGGHPKIDYTIKVTVFGIPLPSIKNDFSW